MPNLFPPYVTSGLEAIKSGTSALSTKLCLTRVRYGEWVSTICFPLMFTVISADLFDPNVI